MASVQPIRKRDSEPVGIHDHAMDHLRYIRETMERAESFTAVPGWGGVAMGVSALIASLVALGQHAEVRLWLAIWMTEGVLAVGIGMLAMARKSANAGASLWSAPARKFVFSFVPPLVVGAILTMVLWRVGAPAAIPGMWLMLYGTGVVTGGAFSVPIVPVMGGCFLAIGALALLWPAAWLNWQSLAGADAWLAAGFGGLHLVFGAIIAKRYGG